MSPTVVWGSRHATSSTPKTETELEATHVSRVATTKRLGAGLDSGLAPGREPVVNRTLWGERGSGRQDILFELATHHFGRMICRLQHRRMLRAGLRVL